MEQISMDFSNFSITDDSIEENKLDDIKENKNIIYGRAIILRNCGRFLNIASDFGSEYKTHPFLTEQMVYAGLTRENELFWDSSDDRYGVKDKIYEEYNFEDKYKLGDTGIYFTCGYLIDKFKYENEIELWNKNRINTDINIFNSIKENGQSWDSKEKYPKHGNIESILPNNYFLTFVFSTDKDYLDKYYNGQTFYMGKKRTMFQIQEMSDIVKGNLIEEEAELSLPIQVNHNEVDNFNYYSIMTLTQRYILLKGKTKLGNNYRWNLDFKDLNKINLPKFFVDKYLGLD
ncbi:hypothetical protein [Orenia marismortui]|uniref:Uncharacterized protein n=1 Tax=Orenia marismortui TaxID=46469 RepID=A0A4R8HL63_9FIRM|nr:hypothetical protein [Orenia marismortui]TDX59024.1 hypothetical protein C7959_102162 [Orenia marismortui]